MASLHRWSSAVLVLSTILARPAVAADRADKRDIIRQARAAYYSLRQKGLDSYSVNVTVNWEVVLKGQIADPVQKANTMKLLNGLHFSELFDAAGKTVVTHGADIAAPNAKSQAGFDQIFTGIAQVISGFMDTYSPFMVTSPLPAVDSDYVLEDFNGGYRLTYNERPTTRVITMMTKALVITETIVNAEDFNSSIKPSFLAVPEGYVLAGYDGDYRPTKTTTGVVKLAGTLEHRVVDGLRLPYKLYFDSSVDGAPSTELTFTDYVIKKG